MGRMTDDVTRLVGEIQASRDDRGRMMQDRRHAMAERRTAVAHLRNAFATDLAGARTAWAGMPRTVPAGRREVGVEREAAVREAAADQGPLQGERPARDDAQTVRKARRRHQPR